MLELICLNHLLHIAHDKINDTCYEKKFNEHLKDVRIMSRWVNQRKSELNSAWSLEIAITEY